jgi:hypothetical protein
MLARQLGMGRYARANPERRDRRALFSAEEAFESTREGCGQAIRLRAAYQPVIGDDQHRGDDRAAIC